jgi:hypothetical protein
MSSLEKENLSTEEPLIESEGESIEVKEFEPKIEMVDESEKGAEDDGPIEDIEIKPVEKTSQEKVQSGEGIPKDVLSVIGDMIRDNRSRINASDANKMVELLSKVKKQK